MKLEILDDQAAVAKRAATMLCELCQMAVGTEPAGTARQFVNVALSGGTTPRALYKHLITSPWREAMPWDRVRWFLSDERSVPIDHHDSNFHTAREVMFDPVGVAESLQFPVPHVGVAPPLQVAADYEVEVLHWVPPHGDARMPSFDVLFLGVGTDGHTASLFPHTKALQAPPGRVIEANYVDKMQTWRITVTPEVIRQARHVIVMVTGEDKAEALKHVLGEEDDFFQYPAQIARTDSSTWLIDKPAAALLEHKDSSSS